MKVVTTTIAWNEKDIIECALNEDLYNFADQQIIIDGSPEGPSTDGTSEFLDAYRKTHDKAIVVHGKFGSHEAQDNWNITMRNVYLNLMPSDTTWVLLVDADEIWDAENLANLKEHMLLTDKDALKFEWIHYYGDFHSFLPAPMPSRAFRYDPTLNYINLDVHPYYFSKPGCAKGKRKNIFSDNELCKDVVFHHIGHAISYDKEFRRTVRYAKRGQPRVSDPEAYARRTLINYPYHKGRKKYEGEQPEIMKRHPLYKENYTDPPRGLD